MMVYIVVSQSDEQSQIQEVFADELEAYDYIDKMYEEASDDFVPDLWWIEAWGII